MSSSQVQNILIVLGVKTGVLLSDFARQLRRKNADVRDIYITLVDAAGISPTLILNQNAKAKKREELWSISKPKHQKLQTLFTQGLLHMGLFAT